MNRKDNMHVKAGDIETSEHLIVQTGNLPRGTLEHPGCERMERRGKGIQILLRVKNCILLKIFQRDANKSSGSMGTLNRQAHDGQAINETE